MYDLDSLWLPIIKLACLQFVRVLCCCEGGGRDRVGGVGDGLGKVRLGTVTYDYCTVNRGQEEEDEEEKEEEEQQNRWW